MTTLKQIQTFLKDKGVGFEKVTARQYIVNYKDKNYIFNTKLTIKQIGELVTVLTDYDTFIANNCIEQVIVNENALIDADKIPKQFEGFYFPDFITNMVRRVNNGANVFSTGPSGCGKSECVEKLAKVFGITLLSVDFSAGTNSQELIGKFIVKNGQTEFIHGIVPLAMKNGWWLNFNELDYATPDNLAILNGVLTGKDLLISQNENETIAPHKDFRIFATANTKGRGTDTGYTGTNFLNLAFLDRFSIFEFDYTKHEPKILDEVFHNRDSKLSKMLVELFQLLRKASNEGKILNSVFSTRRLREVATSIAYGESFKDAIFYDLLGRFETTEQNLIQEFINDIFDGETYTKNDWFLGQKHFEPPVAPDAVNPNAQPFQSGVPVT